jgi:hypothetical protein
MSGIDLLEVPRPQWQRESKDNGHYNAFNLFLIEILSFSSSVILNGVYNYVKNFTCLSSMGWASVIDYLIGDPNSHCIFVYDFSIGNKQANSNCYSLFKICQNIGSRPPTCSSQSCSPSQLFQRKLICL